MDEQNNVPDLPSDVINYLKSESILIESFVAKGSFSNVFKVNSGNKIFALKAIQLKDETKQRTTKDSDEIRNEIRISEIVSHKYIVKNHRILEFSDNYVFLINDFADGGDLITIIEKDEELGETTVRTWFAQVVEAVDYLHHMGIAHRDIKPDNVLLHHGLAKLTDFGLAQFALKKNNDVILIDQFRGTHEYSSPENLICIIDREPFDPFVSDSYSLGILLFILLTLNFPFGFGKRLRTKEGVKRLYQKQMEHNWRLTKKYKSNAKLFSLLRQLLNPDVSSRARVSQILSHPWFNN